MKNWHEASSEFLRRTVTENPYIPWTPEPKQALFLALTGIEALFGGAAGPGKSAALLMAALQFVHEPNYAALLLRKSYADLNQPSALIPRSFSWLGGTEARWVASEHAWKFPSGAVVKFGYLDNPLDIYQFQSSEFQFIGYDELTQFREFDYRYLFSRLRRPEGMNVPLRCRSASNPGGVGHEWVKRRFIVEGKEHGRVFVPARLQDNPNIDQEAYIQSMGNLDPITRRQLLQGDWTARQAGMMFRREWFKVIDALPNETLSLCRFWDLAATEKRRNNEPDWTSGGLVGLLAGQWFIKSVVRRRGTPKEVEDLIFATAQADGPNVKIRMEREPGASGISLVDHFARDVLVGYDFLGVPSLSNKISKFAALSSAAEGGNVFLVSASWNGDFLDEAEGFDPRNPNKGHDDQLDVVSGAMGALSLAGSVRATSVPTNIRSRRAIF